MFVGYFAYLGEEKQSVDIHNHFKFELSSGINYYMKSFIFYLAPSCN